MRSDKKARHDLFVKLLSEALMIEPVVTFEDEIWVHRPQGEWLELLGVSGPTFRELAKHPPVVRAKTKVQGKPAVLYRLGEAPHLSPRHIANQMTKYFRSKFELARVPSKEWGCLLGLAGIFPEGHQVEIFSYVVNNWSDFMGGIQLVETDADMEKYTGWFFKYPTIPIMRKYPVVAMEMYVAHLQKSAAPIPPELTKCLIQLEKNLVFENPDVYGDGPDPEFEDAIEDCDFVL